MPGAQLIILPTWRFWMQLIVLGSWFGMRIIEMDRTRRWRPGFVFNHGVAVGQRVQCPKKPIGKRNKTRHVPNPPQFFFLTMHWFFPNHIPSFNHQKKFPNHSGQHLTTRRKKPNPPKKPNHMNANYRKTIGILPEQYTARLQEDYRNPTGNRS